jgi:hypothetical protein|tara:strand:+ start:36 stop:269 length:234 start_codon:yes stop_codon:yes gene_type:complete
MAKSLEESLENGIVLIKFQSLKSGKIHEREYTLDTQYMKNPTHIIKQSGDKLLCYDIDFGKWEDIEKETIIEWSKII